MIAWVQPRVFLEASPSHRASRGICRLSMSAEEDVPIVPKMVVFDLDGTLWYPEMYMLHGGSPFRSGKEHGHVVDSSGTKVKLIGASLAVLKSLKTEDRFKDTLVGIASRTDEPTWAQECMRKIELGDGLTMKSVMDHEAIYYGDKSNHFRHLAKESKVPFEDMIFFDNEMGNIRTISKLGVKSVYTPDGVTQANWTKALTEFADQKKTHRNASQQKKSSRN